MNIGDRVQILRGLPSRYGQPVGAIRAVGPVNVKVQLYIDGSERSLPHGDVQVLDGTLPLVVVGCGGQKLDHPAPAGEMYTGQYHLAGRRAAQALTTWGMTRILSAKYGLLRLNDRVEPYDLRLGQDGAITPLRLAQQAKEASVQARVIVLAGKDYVEMARTVWPYAEAPLEGTAGIGEQLSILKRLAARVWSDD